MTKTDTAKWKFRSTLVRPPVTGAWTYLDVPSKVSDAMDARGQVKVKGKVNGVPFRSTMMPHGDGTHFMVVPKALRTAAGVETGDKVDVELEPDAGTREVDIPPDLAKALAAGKGARTAFDGFSYSRRKEYVAWIESAKKPETRARRIEEAIPRILRKEPLKQ